MRHATAKDVKYWKSEGEVYIEVVTLINGEETTDLFDNLGLKDILGMMESGELD